MIESMSKAFRLFSKTPFLFVWGSLLYLFLLIVCLFAACGLFLIYFMSLSAFDQELDMTSIPTLAVLGIIVLLFLFFANGLNAALVRTYKRATTRGKMSLARFFSYAIDRAPEMFGIMLVREFIWLLLVGPFLAIYIYFLQGYEFMDVLLGTYAFFMTFIIHMLFTPAFVLAGAYGTDLFTALKLDLDFLKKKHIFFIGAFIVFALVWLLNFVPFLNVVTLFFVYPVVYTAMVVMLENVIKVKEEY